MTNTYILFGRIKLICKSFSVPYADYFHKELSLYYVEDEIVPSLDTELTIVVEQENFLNINNDSKFFGNYIKGKHSVLYRLPSLGSISLEEHQHGSIRIKYTPDANPSDIFYFVELFLRNLAPLSGISFLHASAFVVDETPVLIMAWGGTGKTSILLEMLKNGYDYLGDDLIPVTENGEVFPYTKRINLMHYNVKDNKNIISRVLTKKIIFFSYALDFFSLLERKSKSFRIFNYLSRKFRVYYSDKLNIKESHFDIFPGTSKYAFSSLPLDSAKLYFIERSNLTSCHEVTLDKELEEIAKKMAVCLQWERQHFGDFMLATEFAFPSWAKHHKLYIKNEEDVIQSFIMKSNIIYHMTGDTQYFIRRLKEHIKSSV